jgi:porin
MCDAALYAQDSTGSPPAVAVDAPSRYTAAEIDAVRKNFESNYLLGDWGGARTALWEMGIDPQFLLITDPYGNPTGGQKQGFSTYSMFCADLGIDTERAFALPGGEFDVGFSVNFGTQLTQDYVARS